MKLSENTIYETKKEAQTDIEYFKEAHPNSRQEWIVKKQISWMLEKIQ